MFLTTEQHQQIVNRLLNLGKTYSVKIPYHSAGVDYTSLMVCFLLHNLSSAEALLKLSDSFTNKWFPVTVGYVIGRTMFETDVTAHYITQRPKEHARLYIEFSAVLNKRKMDACSKHRNSTNPSWQEAMSLLWQNHWASRENEVNKKFKAVVSKFTNRNTKGRESPLNNWSGKSIRQMAKEVNHEEAYDIFYAELSSFTHADVHLADRFLKYDSDGPIWSQRADESDVGNIFRHAASFLTCFLELFGNQFKLWSETDVQECWQTES